MIFIPIALVALLLLFEDRLAPYAHRAIERLAMSKPLTVEQAHAARPDLPTVKRPRRWGVTRVVDAQGKGWV